MLMHFGGVNMFEVVWESHLFQFVSIKIERGLSVPLLNRPVGPSSTNSKGSFQNGGIVTFAPVEPGACYARLLLPSTLVSIGSGQPRLASGDGTRETRTHCQRCDCINLLDFRWIRPF